MICFYTFGMEFLCYATIIFCSVSIKKSLDVAMAKAENERMNEINREVTTTLAIQVTNKDRTDCEPGYGCTLGNWS